MRITLALQDQDGVLDSVDRAVADYLSGLPREDRDEDGLADAVRRRIEIELARWIENDAFITVEVDLDRREARVVPVGESGLAEAPTKGSES